MDNIISQKRKHRQLDDGEGNAANKQPKSLEQTQKQLKVNPSTLFEAIAIDFLERKNPELKITLCETQMLKSCNNYDYTDESMPANRLDDYRIKCEQAFRNKYPNGTIECSNVINSNKEVQRVLYLSDPRTKPYNPAEFVAIDRKKGDDYTLDAPAKAKLKKLYDQGNLVIKAAGSSGSSNTFITKQANSLKINSRTEKFEISASEGFAEFINYLEFKIKQNAEDGSEMPTGIAVESLIMDSEDYAELKQQKILQTRPELALVDDDFKQTIVYKRIVAIRNDQTGNVDYIPVYRTRLANISQYGTDNHSGKFIKDSHYCLQNSELNQARKPLPLATQQVIKNIFAVHDVYNKYRYNHNENYELRKYRGKLQQYLPEDSLSKGPILESKPIKYAEIAEQIQDKTNVNKIHINKDLFASALDYANFLEAAKIDPADVI